MTEIEFEIAGPPVPCARPRVVRTRGRGVRTIMPKRTVEYENRVALAALAARPEGWPLTAFYSVSLVFYREANRGDVDNFMKAVLDGAAGVLWKNDSTVVDLRGRLKTDRTNPRTTVRIEIVEG